MNPVHRVVALNDAATSDNRIHADDVAQKYGFRGGLVPGVVTWGHLADPVIATLGPAWLQDGTMTARLTGPVYDGDELAVIVEPEDGAVDQLVIRATTDAGTVAEGRAALLPPGGGGEAPPDLDEWPAIAVPNHLSDASPETLAAGTVLAPWRVTAASGHPGWLLRQANAILLANRRLGPWMHGASDVRHLGLVHEGDELEVRGRVAAERERNGRRFVDLDLLYLVGESRPVWRVSHTAIYDLG